MKLLLPAKSLFIVKRMNIKSVFMDIHGNIGWFIAIMSLATSCLLLTD